MNLIDKEFYEDVVPHIFMNIHKINVRGFNKHNFNVYFNNPKEIKSRISLKFDGLNDHYKKVWQKTKEFSSKNVP